MDAVTLPVSEPPLIQEESIKTLSYEGHTTREHLLSPAMSSLALSHISRPLCPHRRPADALMSASPPPTGSLPLKKRTQRPGSPSGCPQQQQPGSPSQPEHKFKVPAPYRNPSRVTGARERPRARPDRSLSSLVAPEPLYYRFWDQSYTALPNKSSVASLAGGGHTATAWRERYPSNGHPEDWAQGRTIQEVLHTPPGASLHTNYLPAHPSTAHNTHGYAYRYPRLLSGHGRPKVSEAESTMLHTHRSPGGVSPYENSGVPGWDYWLVPPVRTNHLLCKPAKPNRHDSIRRRRERYLVEEYSRALLMHSVSARTPPAVVEKPPYPTSTGLLCVSDGNNAKEHLSPHLSGKAKWREETHKNSELPLLVGSGSAAAQEQPRQYSREHRTEHKSLSPSTSRALAFSPDSMQHFAVGSLIELSEGRCKRVEDLQTEDFLLCADTCPEIRLRSCTVRHICASSSSPELAQVVILLDEQHIQDSLEVFVGFPFFVCGQGWASCCPQRTARLCGLRCQQLGVGDVCLALSPSLGTSSPATGTTASGP